jgi:hypothetical protein
VKLLREYIIELLTESAIDPKIMSMIDKLEQRRGSVKVKRNGISVIVDGHTIAMVTYDPHNGGYGKCLGSDIVSFSEAEDGFGPLAYDIAIETTGGLTPDREEVSSSARNVWAYYEKNRPDVSVEQLDDENNTLTPEEIDNCKQDSAIQDVGSDEFEKSPLSKVYKKSGTPVIDELRKRGMIRE